MVTTVAIACDHAAVDLKQRFVSHLEANGIHVTDCGTHSHDSVDYPDHVHPLASSVSSSENDCGILICGSGNGVAMTANKVPKLYILYMYLLSVAFHKQIQSKTEPNQLPENQRQLISGQYSLALRLLDVELFCN